MEKTLDTAEAQKESPKPPKAFFRVLTPRQAAMAMPVILEGVMRSLPAEQQKGPVVTTLGNAMLAGTLQAWFLNRGDELSGIATTYIYTESFVGDKVLCLYTVYSQDNKLSMADWREAYETLEKYARENGCSRIVAFALNEKVETLAKAFGWTLGPRRLVKEVV